MSLDKFTRDEEMNLIELISQNRCIYDASHDNYKNNYVKDNIWKMIATEMEGKTDEMCKKRWRSIRDTHKRQKKQDKLGTGSAARKTMKWPLASHLTFLDNVQEERRSFSNIVEESLNVQEQHNSGSESEGHQAPEEWPVQSPPQSCQSTPSASSSRKRRKSQVDDEDLVKLIKENKKTREQIFDFLVQNEKSKNNEDDVDLFYKSIALSVKRLPPHLISSAKTQHLQILSNLETEAANLQQGLAAIQYTTVVPNRHPECSSNQSQSFALNEQQVFSPSLHQHRALISTNENPGFLGEYSGQNSTATFNNNFQH